MGRLPSGSEALDQARLDLTNASSVHQLRAAQAVVFPLDLGLSLTATAKLIGMTPGWVARARVRYIQLHKNGKKPEIRGGRRNNLLTLDEEVEIVRAAISKQRNTWDSLVVTLRKELERRLQQRSPQRSPRTVALSTAYNILNRVRNNHPGEYDRWKYPCYYVDN